MDKQCDDLTAEEALAALRGFECELCSESCEHPLVFDLRFQPVGCWHSHCPFCGRTISGNGCEHVLCSDNGEGQLNVEPFNPAHLPRLPNAVSEELEWSDEQLAEVFGELLPCLDAYDDLRDEPDPVALFECLVQHVSVPLERVRWNTTEVHPIGSCGWDYFTRQRDEARAELAALISRLAAGFAGLDASFLARQTERGGVGESGGAAAEHRG